MKSTYFRDLKLQHLKDAALRYTHAKDIFESKWLPDEQPSPDDVANLKLVEDKLALAALEYAKAVSKNK